VTRSQLGDHQLRVPLPQSVSGAGHDALVLWDVENVKPLHPLVTLPLQLKRITVRLAHHTRFNMSSRANAGLH
jgi:hypothetical protein